MARTSVIANLGKMLAVQSGLQEGLSLSKACRAAGTSSGTYKKWTARYAAHGTPLAVAPLSRQGYFLLSGDSRRVCLLDFTPAGMHLTAIDTTTSERIIHQTDEPSLRYDYRSVVAAGISHTGDRVLFLRNKGELLWWHPGSGLLEECSLNLKDNICDLGCQTSSGVRRWTTVSFSHDLSTVACWHRSSTDSLGVLKVIDVASGEERLSRNVAGRHIRSRLVFHPDRPLLGYLADNKLITVLNHQTGEVLVEGGPQAHSVSFSTGDTLLFDDWYGKTMVFNYLTGDKSAQSAGWGSEGSQSSRFITASTSELQLRDTTDASLQHSLPIEEIIECRLSNDGRLLAIRTDHLGIWETASLLEGQTS